ncbi:MAG: 50S ribosomal protein L17 [Chloroflexota bacterium]|nr:50S ribosomal protein L17 [Chloroflexota bacterium]MDE2854835.1 50S ribosomal protein L17 [Chloroflexota bacterium]MDE2945854.1 50S ribosomal protein L17 [Chloroflexota bacterium]
MRHRRHGKKLNRSGSHRKALRMNLASQLLIHGRIKTTFHKAKFVQGHAERLITIAKRGLAKAEEKGDNLVAVHARRQVARRLNNDRDLVGVVFDELAPLYADRPGGYTRILKLGPRKGDNAEMALIELVDHAVED